MMKLAVAILHRPPVGAGLKRAAVFVPDAERQEQR